MRLIKPDHFEPEELNFSKVADALSHPVRRRILELLLETSIKTKAELCSYVNLSKVALYKHVQVLKDAGLITYQYRIHFQEIRLNTNSLDCLQHFIWKMKEGA